MKLTKRQQTFLSNLLDLWHEFEQQPIHYTELAERVGVNRFTAYDMMRLLEEKGMVVSTYQTSAEKSPGRSTILFKPSLKAQQVFARATSEVEGRDWTQIRHYLIEKAERGESEDPDLLSAVLARIEGQFDAPNLQYCLDIVTVIALRISHPTFRSHFAQIIPDPAQANAAQLNLFAGFALGVLVSQLGDSAESENSAEIDPYWEAELISHIKQYQNIVATLDPHDCHQLAVALQTVMTTTGKNVP